MPFATERKDAARPEDVFLVGQLLRQCRAQGLDDPEQVFTELQRARPDWDRPRWDQALRELHRAG